MLTEVVDFGEFQGYFTTSNLNENGQNEPRLAGFDPLNKFVKCLEYLMKFLVSLILMIAFSSCAFAESSKIKSLKSAAEAGDSYAQYLLGYSYENGLEGVEKDINLAKEWYEKSSVAGNYRASYNLGMLYVSGALGASDYTKAEPLFLIAAKNKHERAPFDIALMYSFKESPKFNPVHGYAWLAVTVKRSLEDAATAQELMSSLAQQMTEAQKSDAEKLASEYINKYIQ